LAAIYIWEQRKLKYAYVSHPYACSCHHYTPDPQAASSMWLDVALKPLSPAPHLLAYSVASPLAPQQSKVDALWLALAVMVMPATSYFAIHAAVLNQMLHFWSLLILGCAPLAYLSAVPDGLWWLPMSPRFIKGLSRLLLVLTSLGLLAGAAHRI
jgi:hypothetical protein